MGSPRALFFRKDAEEHATELINSMVATMRQKNFTIRGKTSPSGESDINITQQTPDAALGKIRVEECPVEEVNSLQIESQLETTLRQSTKRGSNLSPPIDISISRESVILPGRVTGDALVCGQESSMVTLSLAGMNGVECEAISVPETMKVKNLILEPALCKVSHDGSIRLLIHNTSQALRRLKYGTYLADFEVLPVDVGTINTMSGVPSIKK